MTSKLRAPGLYEFLQEAELQHYYNGLKNILQVQNVGQLKYVVEDDLHNIGMSKPECRRLKTYFYKYCPGNYASKLRRLLLPGSMSSRREEGRGEYLLGEEQGVGAEIGSRGAIKVPTQHVIPADAISIYKELGQGEFGVVQQGVWTDDEGMRHQVAVKCLSKERMQNNTLEFMKEYEIMQSIDHNHIVRLYGVILDAAQIMLITELAPLRSLLECLKEPSLRTTFTVPCLADFCLQICQGMTYVESKRLIHRDLAARNILVFSKNTVKISDFGLSRALGVGKDYYQTNFNVNLKLPIAWCAPECINFLKFTSASDVWAFGVTIWEMFSYGFQPWAALTGHQILEAIDEQGGQRLEQPVHCPRDYYQLMEACWRHEPSNRPTFAQLLSMLEEARPEQVQVVNPRSGTRHGNLEYEVGDIITVLDKHNVSGDGNSWTGVNSAGKVGRFIPTHTVAYLGTLVPSQASSSWGRGPSVEKEVSSSGTGVFTRAGLRGSKERSSKRKISRDMISGPRGEVQHTGHVGMDGMYFGDVTFIGGTNGTLQITGSRLPSTGSENGFPSLSRADSDVSESAPLLATVPPQPEKPQAPRMGHTIGYLRGNKPSEQPRGEYHQYQSISDEEPEPFGSPLDLGPSLMDEVFGELNSRSTNTMTTSSAPVSLPTEETHKSGGIVDKLADKVSTLTLSRRHKGKKAAFVKPIKASDEKTLDAAIMMANQLASKSMHDLDKRCMDDIFPSPQVSPLTPNSPTKKFTFRFPGPSKGRSTSPKPGSRHFSDEANAHSDLESLVTPTARDAYKVLIEGGESHSPPQSSPAPVPAKPPHRFSLPPTSQVWNTASRMDPPAPCLEPINQDQPEASNPLPLPPKDRKTSVTSGRRHVRKNPLIIPTGAGVARMLQNAEQDVHQPVQQPPKTNYRRPSFPSMREKPFCRDLTPTNDAFEDEIACSIDALDNIPESRYTSPKTSLEHESAPLVQYNQDHVSCEDLLEFSPRSDRGAESDEGRNMKGLGGAGADQCDEVRIMSKVLGGVGADQSTYTAALDLSEWNVHRAIKVVKLRTLVQVPGISDGEMKMALQNRDWDVNKAANDLIKKHRT